MFKILSLFSLIIILTGCSFDKPQPNITDVNSFIDTEVEKLEQEKQKEQEPQYEDWTQIQTGFQVIKIPILDEEKITDTISIFKINPHYFDFKLQEDRENIKTIHDWADSSNDLFIANGSYFDENNVPTGGYIINEIKSGVLTLDGNNGYTSVLSIANGKPKLQYLPENNLNEGQLPENLIESFPTLVVNGDSLIETDSQRKARRTIVASDKNGSFLFIFNERPTFSLYEMAAFLVGSDLEIEHAMNLDGGQSSGYVLSDDVHKLSQPSFAIPNIISITEKSNEPTE